MSHADDTGGDEGSATRDRGVAPNNRPSRKRPTVTAHTTDEGRTVLTESGNCDAWIATTKAVDVRR